MDIKTVFIAEDEPLAREVLRDAIYAQPRLRLIGEAADGASALTHIEQTRPDIVFMDIQMPEMTGLDVLRKLGFTPSIVFTTAYDQYAVSAFKLNAVDYLLKPFTRARFNAAVARVLEAPDLSREVMDETLVRAALSTHAPIERMLVRDRGQIIPIPVSEIAYLKSDSKYTMIAARGRSFLVRIGITELEAQLDPTRFMRIHRSALINLDFVESMKPDEQSLLLVKMRDGVSLTASREVSKILRDMTI
jgi:two-component system LytT family response regulator